MNAEKADHSRTQFSQPVAGWQVWAACFALVLLWVGGNPVTGQMLTPLPIEDPVGMELISSRNSGDQGQVDLNQPPPIEQTLPIKGDFWNQADPDLMTMPDQESQGFLDIIKIESFYNTSVRSYRSYRAAEQMIAMLPASQQEFSWFSLIGTPYLKQDRAVGLNFGMAHHFISGPVEVDLNPRLHEFVLGYQVRHSVGDRFSFDCSTSVGFFSDFKGSAREGVRLPSHAVGMIHFNHRTDFIFGVDYLDRDDIKILPVIGISWHDYNLMSLRYDLVFPRPRIDFTINDHQRLYLMGLLGGGTWDVELANGPEDVMSYRDYRVMVGTEKRYLDGSRRGVELGYAFNRRMTMRASPVILDFRNAFVINFVSTF